MPQRATPAGEPGADSLRQPRRRGHPARRRAGHVPGEYLDGHLFLLGIAISDREHAGWSLLAAVLGMLVASFHLDAAERALDPERLIMRDQFENVQLGLYGYNATLAAVALYLWRRSLIAPILGIVLTVPLTELIPRLGLPALTAPFVIATWLVLALGWLEAVFSARRRLCRRNARTRSRGLTRSHGETGYEPFPARTR